MKTATLDSVTTIHPVTPDDKMAMAGLRPIVEPNKGRMQGTAARGPFDQIIGHTAAPKDVTGEQDTLGGVPGWWARPANAQPGAVILHLHGGWFNWGTAEAYRNLVGHIAALAKAAAFIPDYRLAPEHPFPAAIEDAQAVYRELVNRGIKKIAVTGDSAGGNLALVLLSLTKASSVVPVGAVALSPVTDLAFTGKSWQTRAAADPFFIQSQAEGLVKAYLGNASATDPLASPIYGDLAGLPPVHVHVGEDEVLLDDSRRYVERAVAAGVEAKLDVWEGLAHGFVGGIGAFKAASRALEDIGEFLAGRLNGQA